MTTLLPPQLVASQQTFNYNFADGFGAPREKVRMIDCVTNKREIPMKVLCFGLSRTGTFSLFTALTKLGYKPYHMVEMLRESSVAFPVFEEALEAKYAGKGKPFGREEFDKILGRHDVCIELPGHLFVEELLAAYPDAKVIIHDREVEGWLKSIEKTISAVLHWRLWNLITWTDPLYAAPWFSFLSKADKIAHWSDAGVPSRRHIAKAAFEEHYRNVRALCADRKNVLEYRVQMGWAPLCELLGQEIPEEPFPNINDQELFIRLNAWIWRRCFKRAVLTVLAGAVTLGILGLVTTSLALK